MRSVTLRLQLLPTRRLFGNHERLLHGRVVARATAMSKQSSTLNAALCGALLLIGPAACKQDTVPGTAHAEARTGADTDLTPAPKDPVDNRYDAAVLARTAVQLDPDLVAACSVSDTEAFFAFDSTVVTSRAHDLLADVAECITDGPLRGKELELVGYTDPRGTDEYNKELGLMRAESVAKCLRDHGVQPTQIEINSMGEGVASVDTAEWPSDRRVDIRVKPDVSASR
jgi:outer membrane protein OmpA-like peptidoglycan-associated protein